MSLTEGSATVGYARGSWVSATGPALPSQGLRSDAFETLSRRFATLRDVPVDVR